MHRFSPALIAFLVACGSSPPAPQAVAPGAPVGESQPAVAESHGDPAPHRAPTVIAADKVTWQSGKSASTKMAVLWTSGDEVGRLLSFPAQSRGRPSTDMHDRVAVALAAKPEVDVIADGGPPQQGFECLGTAPCTFYEHTIPRGQQQAASLAWQPYGPDRTYAAAWGTEEAGAFGVLVTLKPNTAAFWHMHGHDVRMVVVVGTVEYVQSGDPPHTLAPGSYVSQAGGYKHSERCTSATDCLLYIHGDHGFSIKPM